MKIVLLPGLDGTGVMFKPFIDVLPKDIEPLIISYPNDKRLGYEELTKYVLTQLPDNDDYILIGESFSGPIVYQLALRKPDNLRAVIFVASFLSRPAKTVLDLLRFLPVTFLLSIPIPIPTYAVKLLLPGTNASEQLVSMFKHALDKVSARTLAFRLREVAKLPGSHHHCMIRAVYIQPTNDSLVAPECVEEFSKAMGNLTIYQVNGPHFILQANPSACAEIISNEVRLVESGATK
jgi:pimeloyl-ACP methyl ester carboxylesterase